jgi:hypothetical protein
VKVSFIVPARNKARHVGRCVRSILGQSVQGMEIVISVQPSEDETLAVVRDLVDGYSGPNEARVLECPVADYAGMAGLNQHFQWLHEHITGDVVIMCSADDYNEPERAERTLEAFAKHQPSYVGTRVVYETPDGAAQTETNFPNRCSRPIGMDEAINYLICSSASSAWSRDLWQKYGPLVGIEAQDMVLPMMAFFERGVYYIDEPLHHHVLHAGLDNTGLEGQMRAARDQIEGERLGEVNAFHNAHHWANIYRRINEAGYLPRLPHDVHGALAERVMNAAWAWVQQREAMTLRRIEPVGMMV